MLKLENKDFKGFVHDLRSRKSKFVVDRKRSVSSVLMGGKCFALSKNKNHIAKKEEKSEVLSLIIRVSKNVSKYIIGKNFQVESINQRYNSTEVNREKYYQMKVGAEFYYIDIAHCYWRIAFLKGYISEKLYNDILKKPNLKTYRNMALACIVAARSREYYDKGKLLYEISEDKSLWKVIYDNIRFIAWNLMGDIKKQVGKNFIAYKTDGMMVTKPAVKKVRDMLTEAGFQYKVVKCIKVDNTQYRYDGKVKKM